MCEVGGGGGGGLMIIRDSDRAALSSTSRELSNHGSAGTGTTRNFEGTARPISF